MQAAIMLGGLGTRLGPLTADRPKALVEVCGRPFIDYQLALLARSGVDEVVLCTGHLGALIEQHVGDGARFGLRARYSPDGERLRGIPGALRGAAPLLRPRFLVTYGDAYLALDYRAAERAFAASGLPAMMVVRRNVDPHHANDVGVVDGRVAAFDKRQAGPAYEFLNYGVTFLRRAVLDRIPADGTWSEQELYGGLAAEGALAAYETDAAVEEIGRPEGLRRFAALVERGGAALPAAPAGGARR